MHCASKAADGAVLAITSTYGVAFDSVSVTNQASRTVQLQFRNAYLRYLSAYVQFDDPADAKHDEVNNGRLTLRAKDLSRNNIDDTILGLRI